ncbi:hypothetical protein ANAPC5_00383 [Anaplasma phagocytophilum]|nr:hypothetical protein ANAPC4_00261 [Anaplasma phagocytophilum]SBO32152.1 hypothetical protein ANAPC3_00768 [Anaplasma phagocytophilum]SBO32305.1 hypothetical protein ANAPC2_00981 [Anaplasma phagocytophilum]SCV62871.1 hypothetical protein ANAPC5_00383 [Anaplasma phagocytophilum]
MYLPRELLLLWCVWSYCVDIGTACLYVGNVSFGVPRCIFALRTFKCTAVSRTLSGYENAWMSSPL